jgi:hypothetical protein
MVLGYYAIKGTVLSMGVTYPQIFELAIAAVSEKSLQ